MINQLKDALDVLKHVKSVKEVAKAALPASMLDKRVLNTGPIDDDTDTSATEVAQALRRLRNRLKGEAIDDQGRVEYGKLKRSETFAELERTSRLLRTAGPEAFGTDEERNAFWINVYNVLAIHAVIALDIDASVMEVPTVFSTVAYDVGGHTITPDEIENGVLRRNGAHPVSGKRAFVEGDPRCAFSPSKVDPRIHAALVCASTSCPPVSFYEPESLDAQLDMAARNYVARAVAVDGNTIIYPITLRYYGSDFEAGGGVGAFVLEHAEGEQKAALKARYDDPNTKIEYARYDWSLNGTL